jgi:hypothetical protein
MACGVIKERSNWWRILKLANGRSINVGLSRAWYNAGEDSTYMSRVVSG